jgi:hypothetical protein
MANEFIARKGIVSLGNVTVTGSLTATNGFTGSFSGSTSAPGLTTQVTYNNDGVLSADSGFVYSGSNVGIGTTTPSFKFDALGSATSGVSIVGQFIGGTGTSAGGLKLGAYSAVYGGFWSANVTPTTSNYALISSGADTGLNSTLAINFYINDSSRATVTSTGLGIGTTSPTSRLQVKGSGATSATTNLLLQNSSGTDLLKVRDDGTTLAKNTIEVSDSSTTFHFRATNTKTAGTTYGFMSSTSVTPDKIVSFWANPSTGTNRIGLLIGNITPPDGIYAIYDGSNYKTYFSGNVGIGTTSPTYKLDVNGDISLPLGGFLRFGGQLAISKVSNGELIFYAGTNSTSGGFNFKTYNGGTYGDSVVIRNSGNVGIGTTTPTSRLQVKGSGATSSTTAFRVENANASGSLIVRDDGNVGIGLNTPQYSLDISGKPTNAILNLAKQDGDQYLRFIGGSGGGNQLIQTAYNLGIDTGGAGNRTITLLTSGNVGIGTTSPASKLSIRSETATHQLVSINRPSSDIAALYLGNDAQTNAVISANNSDLRFGKDISGTFSEYVRIKDGGNVGIGTTTPTSRLQVKGSGTTDATTAFRVENANASGSMVVLDNGNVGIGTTSPSQKLHVQE